MKIKIDELRKFIENSVKYIKEDAVPDDNDEIDLGEPTVIWNNAYDMDDQETSTRIANKRITLDPNCADEIEAMVKYAPQLKLLSLGLSEVAPKGWERAIKDMKKGKKAGKNSINNPWALAYWMKNQGYKPHKK